MARGDTGTQLRIRSVSSFRATMTFLSSFNKELRHLSSFTYCLDVQRAGGNVYMQTAATGRENEQRQSAVSLSASF